MAIWWKQYRLIAWGVNGLNSVHLGTWEWAQTPFTTTKDLVIYPDYGKATSIRVVVEGPITRPYPGNIVS